VIYGVLIIISVWLGLSPLLFEVKTALDGVVALAAALLVVFFSFMGIKQRAKYSPGIIIALGIILIIWAVAGMAMGTAGIGMAIDEIIVGLLYILLAYMVTQLFVFPYASAFDRSNDTLATMSNVKYKDGVIVVNAVLLGSMPATIIMKPEELWKMLPLVESNVVSHLPAMLYKGWKGVRKQVKEQQAKKA